MRTLMTALVMVVALGLTVPAMAQSRPAPGTESSPVPINANMVGAGVLALASASGLVSLYNAGSMLLEGVPLSEALEVGTGLPLLAVAGTIILGGIYGQDIFKQVVAPLFASDAPVKPSTNQSN